MMGSVDFLNLEYLLLRVYRLYTGVDVDTAEISQAALSFWTQITFVGLALALVFLIAIVWFRIRLVAVEHEVHEKFAGAHGGEEEEPKEGESRFEHILTLASSPEEGNWRRAIIEADNMLHDTLTERGFPGDTLGEQLKNANPLQFSTLDLAWRAHKVRNAVAHMGEAFPLTERDVRATIDFYRRVFEEFGVV